MDNLTERLKSLRNDKIIPTDLQLLARLNYLNSHTTSTVSLPTQLHTDDQPILDQLNNTDMTDIINDLVGSNGNREKNAKSQINSPLSKSAKSPSFYVGLYIKYLTADFNTYAEVFTKHEEVTNLINLVQNEIDIENRLQCDDFDAVNSLIEKVQFEIEIESKFLGHELGKAPKVISISDFNVDSDTSNDPDDSVTSNDTDSSST
jgi:hypothetical protein